MAKTKENKAPLRGDNPDYDFTMQPYNTAIIRFNPASVVALAVDLTNMEASVRVINDITGDVVSGTATLE